MFGQMDRLKMCFEVEKKYFSYGSTVRDIGEEDAKMISSLLSTG